VDALKPEPFPIVRDCWGILDADALGGVRSADQLDASSIAQIDGGNHLHLMRSSITALTKSRPANELFSGWN
jgi:hypothetical protein